MLIAEVEIDHVNAVNDVCQRSCCTKYTVRVLGQDLEVTPEQAREIMRRMQSTRSVLDDNDRYYRSSQPVRLKLVLE